MSLRAMGPSPARRDSIRAWKSTSGFSDCDGRRASSAVFARGAEVVVRLIPEKMPKRENCRRVRSVRSCLQPNKTIIITSARLRQSVEHALELVSRVPLLQLPLYICKINGHSFLHKYCITFFLPPSHAPHASRGCSAKNTLGECRLAGRNSTFSGIARSSPVSAPCNWLSSAAVATWAKRTEVKK